MAVTNLTYTSSFSAKNRQNAHSLNKVVGEYCGLRCQKIVKIVNPGDECDCEMFVRRIGGFGRFMGTSSWSEASE